MRVNRGFDGHFQEDRPVINRLDRARRKLWLARLPRMSDELDRRRAILLAAPW